MIHQETQVIAYIYGRMFTVTLSPRNDLAQAFERVAADDGGDGDVFVRGSEQR